MAHFADPHRCPSCHGPIVGPVCSHCGLRLVGKTAGELFRTLQYADTLLDRLRTETGEPVAAVPPVAVRAEHAPRVEVRAGAPEPAPKTPRRATTVPAVLLTLGGISLASGALIFLVIAWFLLGVGGRTAALVLLTAGLGAATTLAARRDLRAAAESLGTLTALFAGFDLVGIQLAWLDGIGLRPYAIGAGLLLAVACAGGVLSLRDRARLWGPEIVGTIGLTVAATAALVTDHHVPVAMGSVMVAGAAAAWTARQLHLHVLAIGALVLAVIGWLLLVGYGVFSAVDDRAAWSTIGPLATAGVASLAVAALLPAARAVAGTIGVWLLVGAAVGWTDWFQNPVWGLLLVTAVAVAGCALCRGPWRGTGIGVGITGAIVLLTAAAAWTADLTAAIDRAGTHGWATAFSADHDSPPWSAVAAVVLLVALAQRVRGLERHPSLGTAAVIAVGLTTGGYAHWTLVPAAFVLAGAVIESVIALRLARGHWVAAFLLGAVAAALATVGSGPESVVWWAAAAVGVVVQVRERTPDRTVAAAMVSPVIAVALGFDGAALGVERRWVGIAAIVVVYVVALVLRSRTNWPPLAGGTLAAMIGGALAGADSTGWLAAELTVVAAGCAIVGIIDRSRVAGLAATALGLVALWLRLGASDVHTPEAYSLPLAAVVLLVGGWAMRTDATRRTVPSIGTGLALALVPTWALGIAHPLSLRALLAGLACVALVAAGAQLRWMAPLLIGAATGAMLALVEIAPYADAVPRWSLLVAIGAGLLVAGVRWESLATAGRRTWGRLADLR